MTDLTPATRIVKDGEGDNFNVDFAVDGAGNRVARNVQRPVTMAAAKVLTTTNPQRLLTANLGRVRGYVTNLSGATDGMIGFDNDPTHATIPLATYDGVPIPGWGFEGFSNELWYHGVIGAVLGVAEG